MIRCTVIHNRTGPMAKHIRLESGVLVKNAAAGLYAGFARRHEIRNLNEFGDLVQALNQSECLTYGIPQAPYAKLTTKKRAGGGKIARTRDYFSWPEGPAIWMLDYDADRGALTPDQLHDTIIAAMPELANASMLWTASASSCIYLGDQELAGIRGQRLYIPVLCGLDIPMLGQLLTKRLWLAGHGRIDLSSDGKRLRRRLIDACVWQPERIDFAAGAIFEHPLVQRRPSPVAYGAPDGLFDARFARSISAAQEDRYEALANGGKQKKNPSQKIISKNRNAEYQAAWRARQGASPRATYLAARNDLKEAALGMLKKRASVALVAKELEVTPMTIYRWQKDERVTCP